MVLAQPAQALNHGDSSWQKMERKKITNIPPSFSAVTNISSWRVKSALSNAVSLCLGSGRKSPQTFHWFLLFVFCVSFFSSNNCLYLVLINNICLPIFLECLNSQAEKEDYRNGYNRGFARNSKYSYCFNNNNGNKWADQKLWSESNLSQ